MISKLLEKVSELREEFKDRVFKKDGTPDVKPVVPENKYLTKVCALLRPPEAPRSERALRRPKKIKKPKLRKFTAKINHTNYK